MAQPPPTEMLVFIHIHRCRPVSASSSLNSCLAQENVSAASTVDWRAYAESHTLTDKQAKLAQKLRKREARIQNLQREADKIRVRGRVWVTSLHLCPCADWPSSSALSCARPWPTIRLGTTQSSISSRQALLAALLLRPSEVSHAGPGLWCSSVPPRLDGILGP